MPLNVTEELTRRRLLVAAVIDDPANAVPLAKALLAGGVDIMEVTFRNAGASECVRRIRAEVPGMRVGTGTLLAPEHIDQAMTAGAEFGVSPGYNPAVVAHAAARGFAFIPGVFTAGEMEQSLAAGFELVKLFPASSVDVPKFLKALAGPYSHTRLRIMPFGGVAERNLAEYLALPHVVAVGGSWLADRALQQAGAWDEVTRLARQAMKIAAVK